MTQDKAHPAPAVAVPSEREAEETDLTLVYMCGFSDGKKAALATPPSLPAAQAVEGVEADAARYRWLKAIYTAANFDPASLDLGDKGVVLMFVGPDDLLVSADLDEMIDDSGALAGGAAK